jgi:hypothetical protein
VLDLEGSSGPSGEDVRLGSKIERKRSQNFAPSVPVLASNIGLRCEYGMNLISGWEPSRTMEGLRRRGVRIWEIPRKILVQLQNEAWGSTSACTDGDYGHVEPRDVHPVDRACPAWIHHRVSRHEDIHHGCTDISDDNTGLGTMRLVLGQFGPD